MNFYDPVKWNVIFTCVVIVGFPSGAQSFMKNMPQKMKWTDELNLEMRKKVEKEFHETYKQTGPIKWEYGNYFCSHGNRDFWDDTAEGRISQEQIWLITLNFTTVEVQLLVCDYMVNNCASAELVSEKKASKKKDVYGLTYWAVLPTSQNNSDPIVYEIRELGHKYNQYSGYFAIHGYRHHLLRIMPI